MNKWLEKYSNGDIVQQNYNDVSVSLPEGFVGMGYNTKGRNYSPAWGGQFEEGGALTKAQGGVSTPQAQKSKTLPPILTDDPRKVQAYSDSLNLYNRFKDAKSNYTNFISSQGFNPSYIEEWPTDGWVDQNVHPKIGAIKYGILKNSGGGFDRDINGTPRYYNFYPTKSGKDQKLYEDSDLSSNIGKRYPIYKKPVQPYILQKEPSLKKKVTKAELLKSDRTAFNPQITQLQNQSINLPTTIQQRFPKGDYDYIFGPANSVIGRNYNGQFYSEDMPNQRGNVNQPDLDLLNNPEALKKYVQNKGLKFENGGSLPKAQDGWVQRAANAEFSCAANPRSNLNQSYSEYCNPKKGLDKDEYKALKNELYSGSMKDLLNVEEYYVLKNLADNQNRKMGREDNAYSKYFDQSTGLPISNLTNELKEEGNLRATNRMYPGRKNLLVNDVYQGILKDYNITTPQTPAQTKALLEKAYNIGYAIPKQQDGGFLPKAQGGKIVVTNPNDPRLKAYNDSLTLYNAGVNLGNSFNNQNTTVEQFNKKIEGEDKLGTPAAKKLFKLNGEFPNPIATNTRMFPSSTGKKQAASFFEWKKPVQPVVLQKKQEFSLKKKVTKAELLKLDRTTFTPGLVGQQGPDVQLPTIQNLPYRVEYYDGDINGMTHKNFIDEKAGSEFMKELQNRSYGIPYGVQAYYENTPKKENGGWLDKYQGRGEEPLTKSSADWYEQRKTLPQFSRVAGERLKLLSTLPKVQLTPLEELQKFGAVGEYIKNRGDDASQESLADYKKLFGQEPSIEDTKNIIDRSYKDAWKEYAKGKAELPESWKAHYDRFISQYPFPGMKIEPKHTFDFNYRNLDSDKLFNLKNDLPKNKKGGVVKDDMGYWNPDNHGKVVEIDSPYITMEGVDQPLIGISDEGDQKYMLPGKNYKFKGKKVREYPVAKNGVRQEQKGLQNLDDLLNFTNYNKPQPGGWLNKYN